MTKSIAYPHVGGSFTLDQLEALANPPTDGAAPRIAQSPEEAEQISAEQTAAAQAAAAKKTASRPAAPAPIPAGDAGNSQEG